MHCLLLTAFEESQLCSDGAGDTDTSSDFEAIPTMRGLAFRDQPSPPGSEFNTPRASAVGRASSITDDEGQFETPRATAAGAFGSMNPVQLQGPVFQVNFSRGKVHADMECSLSLSLLQA